MRIYQPRMTALEDLLATGNIRNISNFELRLTILNFYESTRNWQPYDEFARELIWKGYRNEATAFIPLPFIKAYYSGKVADKHVIRDTLNSEVLQRGIRNVVALSRGQKQVYESFETKIKGIISQIDEELKK